MKNHVLLMAHRGGEGRWPSNTLFAFEQAIASGADVLEMDLQITADRVLVVRHDPFVESTTDGAGSIKNYTLSELKKLDAGYTWTDDGGQTFPFRGRGITIPTLEEVLQVFPAVQLNIDIKPAEPWVVLRFSEMLQANNRLQRLIVGSFHEGQLQSFRRLCPGIPTAASVAETRLFYFLSRLHLDRFYNPRAQTFQVPEYAGAYHIVTRRFISAAHRQCIPVHVWTVNEREDMLRLIEWGVDGFFTDYPDVLRDVLLR